jgi:putative thioredoxin
LEKLAHKQALEVSPSRFSSDTADLLRVLDSSLAAFPPPRLEVIDVTDETYSTEVVERSRIVPVVVQFWTDWCSPKQVGPVLKKLFEEATGKWILARVDADRNPIITNALKVQSVPTVVAIVNGHTIEQFIGDMPEPQIRQWLETIMKGAQRPEVRQGH